MPTKTLALAALLLAGGADLANGQTGGSPADRAPDARSASEVPPSDSYLHNPKVNPSASGTLREGDMRSPRSAGDETQRYGGSKEIDPNTHPLKSPKARPRKQEPGTQPERGATAPPGVSPTMNRDAGRWYRGAARPCAKAGRQGAEEAIGCSSRRKRAPLHSDQVIAAS